MASPVFDDEYAAWEDDLDSGPGDDDEALESACPWCGESLWMILETAVQPGTRHIGECSACQRALDVTVTLDGARVQRA